MHGGIQVDSALSDAERRAKLYEDDVFLYSTDPSTQID